MVDPVFWLGLSILLVAVSLAAVLVAALPALQELARAARSAEKLFDTLSRELPPTLESIRLTGMEISDLTDDVSEGVQSAGRVVKQVDQSLSGAKKQAHQAQVTTRSVLAGVKAAWSTLRKPSRRRSSERMLASSRSLELEDEEQNPLRMPQRQQPYEAVWEDEQGDRSSVMPSQSSYSYRANSQADLESSEALSESEASNWDESTSPEQASGTTPNAASQSNQTRSKLSGPGSNDSSEQPSSRGDRTNS